MSRVISDIARHAAQRPDTPALEDRTRRIAYRELATRVASLAASLRNSGARTIGLLADNGIDWALADLAALSAGVPIVPLPTFFSATQLGHAIERAGVDLLLTDRPALLAGLPGAGAATPFLDSLSVIRLAGAAVALPPGTLKITFTSGSTGAPKGVCLGREAIEAVAVSLCEACAATTDDRHLALLPLSTLLENVGGLYVPLLAGATTVLLPSAEVGLQGSSGGDPIRMLGALAAARASSAILVPQLLLALVAARRAGAALPAQLRYLAVGGARVSPRLLAAAQALGLPACEGYGLSECASVVALNRPGDAQPGSVGRVLPHAELRIASDGGVSVRGAGFLGYLGEAPRTSDAWVDTGDIGRLDADGRLYLRGRRRNVFITAFGRNVSPEWVEGELLLEPAIAQAAVFGEASAVNTAVLVARPGADDAALAEAVAAANRGLPDYARVGAWLRAGTPFTPANGQLTQNGRLRREAIAAAYRTRIEQRHERESHGIL